MSASFQPSSARKVAGLALLSQSTMLPMKPNSNISEQAMTAEVTAISASHFLAPWL